MYTMAKIVHLPSRKPAKTKRPSGPKAKVIRLPKRYTCTSGKEWIQPGGPGWMGTYTPVDPYGIQNKEGLFQGPED